MDRDDYRASRRRDYDDAPRSRRRAYDDDRDDRRPKRVSTNGILSLIQGIGALIAAIIPCLAPFGIFFGVVALIFGIIGLVIARKTRKYGTGIPIAAICVSTAAIVVGTGMTLVMRSFIKKIDDSVTEQREEQKKEVQAGPALRVSAPDLNRSFPLGRIGTNSQYYNKVVEVTGTVRITSLKFAGSEPFVGLDVEDRENPGSIHCKFDEAARAAIERLEYGSQVTIRGRCTGRLANLVTVEDCKLTAGSDSKDSSIRKTAMELGAEFRTDHTSLKDRYSLKRMEITGTISEINLDEKGRGHHIFLDAGDGIRVEVPIQPGQNAAVEALTVGQQVTVRGLFFSSSEFSKKISLGVSSIVEK